MSVCTVDALLPIPFNTTLLPPPPPLEFEATLMVNGLTLSMVSEVESTVPGVKAEEGYSLPGAKAAYPASGSFTSGALLMSSRIVVSERRGRALMAAVKAELMGTKRVRVVVVSFSRTVSRPMDLRSESHWETSGMEERTALMDWHCDCC